MVSSEIHHFNLLPDSGRARSSSPSTLLLMALAASIHQHGGLASIAHVAIIQSDRFNFPADNI